jgi:hypothetical protein
MSLTGAEYRVPELDVLAVIVLQSAPLDKSFESKLDTMLEVRSAITASNTVLTCMNPFDKYAFLVFLHCLNLPERFCSSFITYGSKWS